MDPAKKNMFPGGRHFANRIANTRFSIACGSKSWMASRGSLLPSRRGRHAAALTVAEGGKKAFSPGSADLAADELAAIIGLTEQVTQRDTKALQAALDAGAKDLAGGRTASLGEGL